LKIDELIPANSPWRLGTYSPSSERTDRSGALPEAAEGDSP
jgi:hypothetical protein